MNLDDLTKDISLLSLERRAQLISNLARYNLYFVDVGELDPCLVVELLRVLGDSPSLRKFVLGDPQASYNYAAFLKDVARGLDPNIDDLREAASKESHYAYYFARDIDHGPHDVTRRGACQDAPHAFYYALKVDSKYHDDTWAGVLSSEKWRQEYLDHNIHSFR